MSDEKLAHTHKMTLNDEIRTLPILCQYCWDPANSMLVQHYSSDCSCPLAICTTCLVKNSKQKSRIQCPGCDKAVKAVQFFKARHFASKAKKFLRSSTKESIHLICGRCMSLKPIRARHNSPNCTANNEICFECALGENCSACDAVMTSSSTVPVKIFQTNSNSE